jgi:4-hydroxy-tetrahydrodipicolinate synthase
MSTGHFEGIFAATVTPMSSGGAIEYDVIEPMVERLIENGIAGLVPCGGTGEFSTLTTEERLEVAKRTIRSARGRIPVIPHTGALSTGETIELSVEAEREGAAGVMVAPPYFDPISAAELFAHYRAVAKAVNVPVVIYNHPGSTKVDITPAMAAELSEIEGIRYIKDSSGNAAAVAQLLAHYGERITLLTGADTLAFYAMLLGAKGAIWGAANVTPRLCSDLYRAVVLDGDLVEGRQIWQTLWPLMDALESMPYAPAVKYGCQKAGMNAGPPRSPFLPLTGEQCAQMDAVLSPVLGSASPAGTTVGMSYT